MANIHYGDILTIIGNTLDISNFKLPFVKNAGREMFKQETLKNGDLIFADTAEDYTVGKSTEIYNMGSSYVVSGLHTIACRPKNTFACGFLGYYTNSPAYRTQLLPLMQGIKVYSISKTNLGSTYITYPTVVEQQKIADFQSLVDERIEKQRQLVEVLKRYKRGVISRLLNELSDSEQIPLSTLVSSGVVKLGRGNVIPKYSKDEKRIYPVYSSSVQKNGLMGYFDSYMFDQELITWSIDGGGHFFYRKKHKFNVTNVCGIFEVDTEKYNYKFVAECLIEQHARKHFDYQSKAHPSVIIDMYKLPVVPIHIQEKWSELFALLDMQITTSEISLLRLEEYKQALLQQMFI